MLSLCGQMAFVSYMIVHQIIISLLNNDITSSSILMYLAEEVLISPVL